MVLLPRLRAGDIPLSRLQGYFTTHVAANPLRRCGVLARYDRISGDWVRYEVQRDFLAQVALFTPLIVTFKASF